MEHTEIPLPSDPPEHWEVNHQGKPYELLMIILKELRRLLGGVH